MPSLLQCKPATALFVFLCVDGVVVAAPPAAGPPSPPAITLQAADKAPPATEPLQQLLTSIVLDNLPHTYEDKKKWGLTTTRWDGLKVSVDGLRLKTKRRKKEVNHGTWTMYRVSLADPREGLRVELTRMFENGDGRIGFDVACTARVAAFGRMSKWVQGVQLISLSADADATMRLDLRCLVSLQVDPTHLPPDIAVAPEVTRADLTLVDFELQRLSNLRGDAAEQLGRGLRGTLEKKIDDHEPKLVENLNKQIDKNRDKLRLSLHDLIASKWAVLADHVQPVQPGAEANSTGGN